MKKIICVLIFFLCCTFVMDAQSSLSINYMYIGNKGKYGVGVSNDLVHHGMGFQSKIHLKNRFYLMPDAGYFFRDYEKKSTSATYYQENAGRYYVANVNLAYSIPYGEFFSILPIAGVGYFHEHALMHFVGGGAYYPPNSGFPSHIGAPYDVIDKDNTGSIVCNIGFNIEWSLTKNIFVTAGLKYMFDIYDMKYNAFPYINTGIGYSF